MNRILLVLCLACAPWAFTGCNAHGNLQKFLDKLPATEIQEVRQTFNSPLWSNTEIATNIATDADGLLDIGSASATITSSVFSTSASVTGFKQIPTAEQRAAAAAAKAAKAELAAARAAQRAAIAKAESEEAAKIRLSNLRQPLPKLQTGPDGKTIVPIPSAPIEPRK